ncbi:MAG: hypothetical protein U9O98_08685 [Asgard group archaeon]|nr:hypothetical protein [Asgard group archaeon]
MGGSDTAPQGTILPGDNPGIAALNALIYVGIAFIGATVIFLIFRSGKIKLLKAIFAFAIFVTSFFFVFLFVIAAPYYLANYFYGIDGFSELTYYIIVAIAILFGLLYSVLTVLSMVYLILPTPMPQIMALLFAVLAGTYLATFLPMFTGLFVMIGLSIYDIISVFKGPIRKMAEVNEERQQQESNTESIEETNKMNKIAEDEQLQKISSSNEPYNEDQSVLSNSQLRNNANDEKLIEYVELGLGDIAFFGMLFSFTLLRLGFFPAIGAFIGVILGVIGTIKLLEKVKMMPGLPLSIGLGLVLGFAVWGILLLVNYTGWGIITPDWFSSLV